MRLAVRGADRRLDFLARLWMDRHQVYRDPASGVLAGMDAVVAIRPRAEDLVHMRAGAHLFRIGGAGAAPAGVIDVDLMQDPDFVRDNAHLTAEGALYAAMQAGDDALMGSVCLVVGYGRIAQALVRMLTGFGARVIVAARRAEARQAAVEAGADATDMAGLPHAAAQADFVFSTPPETVMGAAELSRVRSGVPVMDLASPPYGVDLAAAQRLGVRAWRESGVPGRYCPLAAARAMADAIDRHWD